MQINSRPRLAWILITLVLLFGMNCSLLNRVEDSRVEDEATPPSMPTTEGVSQDDLPIPLLPDATNFSSSQGSFSYTTQLSVEEVATFYQEKLPPQGWTIEQQGDMGGTLMWTIARQDLTYLLSIMPSNGMTIVNAGQLR